MLKYSFRMFSFGSHFLLNMSVLILGMELKLQLAVSEVENSLYSQTTSLWLTMKLYLQS